MSGHDKFESPVDLPDEMPGKHGLRWATLAIVIASLFLLITNAFALRSWVDEFAPGPLQARVAASVTRWEEIMNGLGLGMPRAEVHQQWKAAQAARFNEEPSTDQR
jgi:hypothetical protein